MKNKILIIILIIVIIALAILVGVKVIGKKEAKNVSGDGQTGVIQPEEVPQKTAINIWKGNSRSVAVVIDNVQEGRPQTGLNNAAIVYEAPVDGGLTRMLAVFKDIDEEISISSVRSARPVLIDYAMENDSIFVHFGFSSRAESEIKQFKINNVNGLVTDSAFWRTKEKPAPHNVLTNMKKVYEYAEKVKYRTTTTEKSVLNYSIDEIELENGQTANTVNIPYSSSHKVSYKYNAETKLYEKYVEGKADKDWKTGESITVKNIIITFANSYEDPNDTGRQKVENIGNLEGYYITNGKAIKIACSKSSRTTKTIYKDKNGKEIEVNDGNTYIQITPKGSNVTFE